MNTSPESLIPYYTSKSHVTGWFINNFYKSLHNVLGDRQVKKVLEVGCGEGWSTSRIRGFFVSDDVEFDAIEIDPMFAENSRRLNPSVNIEIGSIYDLADRQAELVICLEVLEHLDDPATALERLFAVSSRWVLLSVPREPLWSVLNLLRGKYIRGMGNTPGHLQKWSRSKFVDLVSQYGRVIEIANPIPWTIVLAEVRIPR